MSKKIPEDLGVKIGSIEEIAWKNILDKTTETIAQLKREIIINKAIGDKAKKMISEEKQKFK